MYVCFVCSLVVGKEEADKALQELQQLTTAQMTNTEEMQKLKSMLGEAYASIKALNVELERYVSSLIV
jgi:hypothetical protein